MMVQGPCRWLVAFLVAATVSVGSGCPGVVTRPTEDAGTPEVQDADVGDQAEPDDALEAEWGWECEADQDCNDQVSCTVDVCNRGLCENRPDNAVCQDERVCNGREVCDTRHGCVPGEAYRGCNDANPCTMDRCVEPEQPGALPGCEYLPLDRDGDTHVDSRCGGQDCDDVNASINPGSLESCVDALDNDCNGLVDGSDPACQMDFDNCTSPRSLPLGVEWMAFTTGGTADVPSGCDAEAFVDAVLSFTLTERSDVLVSADNGGRDWYLFVSVQRECGNVGSELSCTVGSRVLSYHRGLEAGTYYVVVSSWRNNVTFAIRVDAWPAEVAEGDTCDNPIELAAPGYAEGNLMRMGEDTTLRCARWLQGPDSVYRFELTELRDVTIEVASRDITPYVSLQTDCRDAATALVCDFDWPFHRTIRALGAGTYYLWVKSQERGEFTVRLTATEAVDPCAGLERIEASGTRRGTTVGAFNDFQGGCGRGEGPDVAYELVLAEEAGVVAEITEATWDTVLYLRRVCNDPTTELACNDDHSGSLRSRIDAGRQPAGTYYLFVDGFGSGDQGTYTLSVTITP